MEAEVQPCPACREMGTPKFKSNIDDNQISMQTYSSRKVPELLHYAYLECSNCGTLFVAKPPSSEILAKSYNEATFISKLDSKYAAETYFHYLKKNKLLNGGQLLDIGCSDGSFIFKVRVNSSVSVFGIEPSSEAIKNADPLIQMCIHHTTLENFESPKQYDLVTCFQTIEHLNNVDSLIFKSKNLLKNGGNFAVICHNRHSVINRLLGKKSPIFDLEHLQIFNKKSIEMLLQRHGFSEIKVTPISNTYPISYWILLAPIPEKIKRFVNRHRDSNFCNWGMKLRVGNLLVIGKK